MSTTDTCKTCKKPKASYTCGICQECTCKNCTQFLTETFDYRKVVPKDLTHPSYCGPCFDERVARPLQEYNETMEKARDIIIYSKAQTQLTRFLKRKAEPYRVENCEEEKEALMRMSFFAVEAGYNCLIDVVLSPKKIVTGSHKKIVWSATGAPITIDPTKIRGHVDPP